MSHPAGRVGRTRIAPPPGSQSRRPSPRALTPRSLHGRQPPRPAEPARRRARARQGAGPHHRGAGGARAGAGHRDRRAWPRVSSRHPIVVATPTTRRRRAAGPRPRRLPRAPSTSICSRPGRRCRSSGSAPPSRPWASGCAPCGACASPSTPAPRARAATSGAAGRRGAGPGARAAARPARRRRRAGRRPPRRPARPGGAGRPAGALGLPARVPGRAPGRGRRARLDRRRVPVHRRRARCASTCGATRSTGSPSSRSPTSAPPIDVDGVEIFPCRELLPTDEVRARAEALIAAEPWGREQWERLAEGLTFDGMESWLPWLTEGDEQVLFDLLPADAQVLLVEPRRLRDRAADILAEEADLAGDAGQDLGRRRRRRRPRVPAPARAVRPAARRHRRRRCGPSPRCPTRPTSPPWPSAGWNPVVGDGDAAGQAAPRPARRRLPRRRRRRRRRVRRPPRPPARRAGRSRFPLDLDGTADLTRPGGVITVAPLERGFILPSVKLAVLAEADLTGRRRAHRRARPRKQAQPGLLRRPQAGRLRRAPPARRRPLRRHGQAGHRRRRARLPAARVPGRRQALRPVRPDRRRPPLHRRRLAVAVAARRRATGRRPRPRCAPRSPRSPRSWSCSTRPGSTPPATPSPRHAVAARDGGVVPVRADPRPAQGHRSR